jgi:hypothetical protein
MKKVTDGQRYCSHHFDLVSFGPLKARVKRAERNKTKMMTIIPLPICNLYHLW